MECPPGHISGRKCICCLDSERAEPVSYTHLDVYKRQLDTLPFQTGAGGRWLRVLFARCSEWNFGEYYFKENFDDFKKAQSKKAVIPKNTVSFNSRCFWVSRWLVSFLESVSYTHLGANRFHGASGKAAHGSLIVLNQQDGGFLSVQLLLSLIHI